MNRTLKLPIHHLPHCEDCGQPFEPTHDEQFCRHCQEKLAARAVRQSIRPIEAVGRASEKK